MPSPHRDLNIEQRFIYATGNTIRRWAFLEQHLYSWLSILGRIDPNRSRIIWFSFPNFRARQRLLQRLAETYLDDVALLRFRSLMKRASKLANKRNALAHTASTLIDGRKIHLMFDDDDDIYGFNFAVKRSFDIENIENFPHAIAQLTAAFSMLIFRSNIHTSPKIYREQKNDPSQNTDPSHAESNGEAQQDHSVPSHE